MQIANILLSIGGDAGNTVPKIKVTAAEIPVLRIIHGEDAIHEIEPAGEISRSNREELQRLHRIYGKKVEGVDRPNPVSALYPGAAARVFERLDELDLPEEFFKAERRVTPNSAPARLSQLDHDGDGNPGGSLPKAKRTRKTEAAAPAAPAEPVAADEPDDDDIEEMDDKPKLFG